MSKNNYATPENTVGGGGTTSGGSSDFSDDKFGK
jgi:hypothetical protein